MNSNRFRTSLLAACAALTIAGGMAYAGSNTAEGHDARGQHRHGPMHRHGGAPLMATLKQLDLTAEQKQSVQAIYESTAEQRKALREQRRANRESLASTLPDDANYPGLIATQKQLAVDAIQQSSDLQTQIFAVLTPEQKAQVPQLMAERKARLDQRRAERQNAGRSKTL